MTDHEVTDDGFKDEWVRLPYSRKLIRELEKRADWAMKELRQKCESSTDPKVTKAFGTLESLERVLSELRGET